MNKQKPKGYTLVLISGIFFSFNAVISLLAGHLDKLALYAVLAIAAFAYAASTKKKAAQSSEQT